MLVSHMAGIGVRMHLVFSHLSVYLSFYQSWVLCCSIFLLLRRIKPVIINIVKRVTWKLFDFVHHEA